jgi:hypothetical protein
MIMLHMLLKVTVLLVCTANAVIVSHDATTLALQTCNLNNSDSSAWQVQLAARSTPIHNKFRASINGSSNNNNYTISVANNQGNVTQAGKTTPVVLKDQIPWGEDLTLYSFIGTNEDEILVGWAYCTGGDLTSLWLEDTDGTAGFTKSTVTGNCNITTTPTKVNLVTKEQCVSVARPAKVPSISGGDGTIALPPSGGPGTVKLGNNEEFNLLPFALVDCATCTDSASYKNGWYEIHAVMTSKNTAAAADQNVCFGIFYMGVDCDGQIMLQYLQCFAGDDDAHGRSFAAGYDLSGLVSNVTTACAAASVTPGPSPTSTGGGVRPTGTISGAPNSATSSAAAAMLKMPQYAALMAVPMVLGFR